jgi:cytosine/adenosine deaminase-related metal-dependent hydrolase
VREAPPHLPAVPAPHAPYSVGPALLRRIFATAAAAGLPTSIHLAEDPDELALLREGGGGWPAVLRALGASPEERAPGMDPCAYVASCGGFATPQPPLLVHMVHAGADDRRRAREAGATVVLCPRSNLHIGGRLPDVPALLADGVALALGTDSLASAPDLSLWSEMATLAEAFADVAPRTWLHAATGGGARALGRGHLGAIQPGKRPGLIDVIPARASTDPERDLVMAPPQTLRWLVPA